MLICHGQVPSLAPTFGRLLAPRLAWYTPSKMIESIEFEHMTFERNILNDLPLALLDPGGPVGVGGLRSG